MTFIADPTNSFKIREGPRLNVGRRAFGCAKMYINGKLIIVVAGGMKSMRHVYLDSVEILDPSTNAGWTPGLRIKKIPAKLCLINGIFILQDQICHLNYIDQQ